MIFKQFSITALEKQPWGKELVEKYPLIFTELDSSNVPWAKQAKIPEAEYVNLRYGFEHREGWVGLIEEIAKTGSELVTFLRAKGYTEEDAFIHSCIVKEKFGGLRWQGHRNLPEPFSSLWDGFVSTVENRSYSVCEYTGGFGSLRQTKKDGTHAWVRTLCTEKAHELGYQLEDWEEAKYAKAEATKKAEQPAS